MYNPTKILFLDFDGVMVTERHQTELMTAGSPLQDAYGSLFDPTCVKFLQEIIDSTDAGIVVTSTWKMTMGLDGIQRMWEERNLPGKVIGVTPEIDPIHRGDEIAAWLAAQTGAVRYAILDDCPILDFFREEQLQHLFRVDERTGLDENTASMSIYHLGRLGFKYIDRDTLQCEKCGSQNIWVKAGVMVDHAMCCDCGNEQYL